MNRGNKSFASAGNRTRINCLEGSYADHYTTDADILRSELSCLVYQAGWKVQVGNSRSTQTLCWGYSSVVEQSAAVR